MAYQKMTETDILKLLIFFANKNKHLYELSNEFTVMLILPFVYS